eukprot:296647_1
MHQIESSKLIRKTKPFIQQTFTFSNEFYYFLIFLITFNLYIFFTLQYTDELLSPLNQNSLKQLSSSSFDDTISRLSPHFIKFEHNCKDNYQNYTLDAWTFITSVLSMDWKYRLIYLFVFYQIALYLQHKYQYKLKKFISNHIIPTNIQQTIKYKLLCRVNIFVINTIIYFCFCMMDVQYSRWSFTNGKQDPALMDYSQITISERIKDIIYIFIRVHPLDSWLVRISHGFSYPFTLYALTRPNMSEFIYAHMLSVAFWAFHIGGLCHTLDNRDMHLRCVRRSFIWSTRGSSMHGEALRMTMAPYLNLICLTIDCAKYIL